MTADPEMSPTEIAEAEAMWERLVAENPQLAAQLSEPLDRTRLVRRPRREKADRNPAPGVDPVL